ncbi:MAG: SAM-dependent methyltransferase [Bdellovibrionota bacterium]
MKYVSRGGTKLEGALKDLQINVEGLEILDVGASTGGFTDCVLQNGAKHVYAIDVGRGQLDVTLQKPSSSHLQGIIPRSRTLTRNIRQNFSDGGDGCFIHLVEKVLPTVIQCIQSGEPCSL